MAISSITEPRCAFPVPLRFDSLRPHLPQTLDRVSKREFFRPSWATNAVLLVGTVTDVDVNSIQKGKESRSRYEGKDFDSIEGDMVVECEECEFLKSRECPVNFGRYDGPNEYEA